MVKLSNITLNDALSHSTQRFRTLLDITCVEIVNTEKYSIEVAVTQNGENKIVKVMVDPEAERTVEIIETAICLERMELPYIAPIKYYPKELKIITTDNQSFMSDVILIEDTQSEMFDYPAEYDGQQIINSFIRLVSEILRKGYVFDQLHPSSFRFNEKREVILSLSKSFIFDGVVNTDMERTRAFRNYLTMILLQLIIETHNQDCNNWEDQIEYMKHTEQFDTRRLSHFLSGSYCEDLQILMNVVENRCKFDCTDLRESIGTMKLKSMLTAFQGISSEPVEERTLDIIGIHSEDRISVRDKKTELMGYVDFKHNLVIDYQYEDCTNFVEGLAVCVRDGIYGVIDKFGETIVPFEYEYLEWNSKANSFYWRKNGSSVKESARVDFLKR